MIDITKLKTSSNLKNFEKSTVIVQEGQKHSTSMFIILQGEVAVYKHYGKPNQVLITKMQQGSFFGEMSLFMGLPRSATVVADSEVTIFEVTRDNALMFFETQPEATFQLIVSLCDRVFKSNQMLTKLSTSQGNAVHEYSLKEDNDKSIKYSPTSKLPKNNLFLEGHGTYELELPEITPNFFLKSTFACPMCSTEFERPVVRNTKLRLDKTDFDLRRRYKDFDPILFAIVTCPHCWFSAFASDFEKASDKNSEEIIYNMSVHKKDLNFNFNEPLTSDMVFASYYLALICQPLYLRNKPLPTARTWLNLSWLYGDCNHREMAKKAGENALEHFNKVYYNMNLTADAKMQVTMILGELNFRYGDLHIAQEFFSNIKTSKGASKELADMATMRKVEIDGIL